MRGKIKTLKSYAKAKTDETIERHFEIPAGIERKRKEKEKNP